MNSMLMATTDLRFCSATRVARFRCAHPQHGAVFFAWKAQMEYILPG